MKSELNLWYLDDGTSSGKVKTLLEDYGVIASEDQIYGLNLNCYKCELIANDAAVVLKFRAISPNNVHVLPSAVNLSGSPIGDVEVTECALSVKLENLLLLAKRLKLLNAHDAFLRLKNCSSIPKLMHLLRSTRCYACEALVKYEELLHETPESILNITLSSNFGNQAIFYLYLWVALVFEKLLGSLNGVPDISLWICRFTAQHFT